ncbi:unnamed protein product [Parascedosporium putredinis]|uniref:Uncharacterized protein n=1 Tax=Parascedosporium putredinis TaxID=1442378 RepID=A0A9P1M5D9_9PEZI|nr:unnamed protein product [Parascedosporium putredinis]CAI7987984.1 unnamed protein product [Parascedosporium putredinis]
MALWPFRRKIEEGYGWDQAPTLYGNRGSVRIPRRKSSRQKQPGHDREAEIRAMASSMSLRRARDTPTPPMRLSSKRIKAGIGFSQHWDGPSTEGSLPGTASIRSEMSTDSEHGAYRLKTLEALAPRPILRYEANPAGDLRTATAPPAHKRVDSLADGLDASDIRELMERDKRRRERKRLTEQARVEKRLARLAEKHLAAQISAAKDGAPLLRISNEASWNIPADWYKVTGERFPPNQQYTSRGNDSHVEEENPPKDIQSPPSMSSHSGASAKKVSKASDSTAKPLSDAARSRSTISPPPATVEEIENARNSGGMQKVRLSFTSLFKWASKNNRRGSGPSSFSNASREEMQAAIRNRSPVPPEESPAVAVGVAVGAIQYLPEPHTMSLASVDSEGSWLSGRLAGAGMGSRRPARRDRADSQATNTSVEEEHGIAEDEYFSRLTPARLMRTTSNPRLRKSTGEALPSSDEDEPIIEGDMKWGSVQARQHPTLVHATDRLLEEDLKSHDGVMNSGDEEHDSESDDIVDTENLGGLQRATSINLGKMAPSVSALEVPSFSKSPRESADSRQRSSAVFL